MELYKRAESLLYNHTKYMTCRDLLLLEYQELQQRGDVKAQSYREHYGLHTRDPVAEHSERLSRLQSKILRLDKKIFPVKDLIHELTNPYALDAVYYRQLLDVLNYIYFGHNPVKETAALLKITISSIYRRKRKLVKMLIGRAKKLYGK